MITLTDRATDKVREYLTHDETLRGKSLRIFAEAGGCSGFQFGLTFDTRKDGDEVIEFEGFSVIVDASSQEYVQGARIDYVETLQQSGFAISQPKAKSSCGCGQSFEM